MVIIHAYTEEQQREAFAHPLCVPGSDATTMAPDGPLAGQVFHGAYTWAAWYLRFCVQQEQVLSLPEAIRRLTSQPAERIGIPDRGVLRAGAHADVAVFDPLAIPRGRHDVRPEPARDGDGHGDRQRRRHAERRRAHGLAQRRRTPARLALRRCNRLDDHLQRRVGERGEDPARVEHFHAELDLQGRVYAVVAPG